MSETLLETDENQESTELIADGSEYIAYQDDESFNQTATELIGGSLVAALVVTVIATKLSS